MLLKTMTDRSESFTPVNGSYEPGVYPFFERGNVSHPSK